MIWQVQVTIFAHGAACLARQHLVRVPVKRELNFVYLDDEKRIFYIFEFKKFKK